MTTENHDNADSVDRTDSNVDPMTPFPRTIMQQYQDVIRSCCKHHDGSTASALVDITFGIATESGEVIGEIKDYLSFYKVLNKHNLLIEIGDLLFSLGSLLNLIEAEFEDAVRLNIAKVTNKNKMLTTELQARIFDNPDEVWDSVSSRKVQVLTKALQVCLGRNIGIPSNEVSTELIQPYIDFAMEELEQIKSE